MEFKFAKLHEMALTHWHFWFFAGDTLLVAIFYPAIYLPKLENRTWRVHIRRFLSVGLLPVRFIATSVLVLMHKRKIRVFNRMQFTRVIDQAFFLFLILAAALYLFIVSLITNENKYKTLVAYMRGDSWGIIDSLYHDSAYHADYHAEFVPGVSTIKRTLVHIPTINVHGQTIATVSPTTQELLLARQAGISADSAEIEYTTGIILQNRDFTLANLSLSRMIKANLDKTRFLYANLEQSTFTKALMRKTKALYANMKESGLNGANLAWAEFKAANLNNAFLEKVNLSSANLQGVNLSAAHLQGANLSRTHLEGANLYFAFLQGAVLSNAHLQAADLQSAYLQGASLEYAQLQGANLDNAHLQGANLSNAQLQGAVLPHVNLRMGVLAYPPIARGNFLPFCI
jgi:uncharacterized protein YjbI with pentapeptide repeats